MPKKMHKKTEQGFFTPAQVLKVGLAALNEGVDWLGSFLNLTGVWAIFVVGLNLLTLVFIFCLNTVTEGFSLSALVNNWQQGLCLILENIPIIGDIIPGWLLYLMVGKKEKQTAGQPPSLPKSPK